MGERNMSKKLTTEQFIQKARAVHGSFYNYSKVNYVNKNTKVEIICPIHGSFWQTPDNHANGGYGCPKCSGKHRYNVKEFIDRARDLHGNVYDYSRSNYVNSKTKLEIICPEHGSFWQSPDNHINLKQGCPHCAGNIRHSVDSFIEKAKKVHENRYDYSNVVYTGLENKIEIICPIHGVFKQTPHHHLSGEGCPKCVNSKGENEIRRFLEYNNIKYEQQKKFKNCRDKKSLPFDFYLPEYNMCIEYQGEQHFRPYNKFGGEAGLEKLKKHDAIKKEFCLKEENPDLLEIKYNDFKILEDILTKNLRNRKITHD